MHACNGYFVKLVRWYITEHFQKISCSDSVDFYNCTCLPGYEGLNCENGERLDNLLNLPIGNDLLAHNYILYVFQISTNVPATLARTAGLAPTQLTSITAHAFLDTKE